MGDVLSLCLFLSLSLYIYIYIHITYAHPCFLNIYIHISLAFSLSLYPAKTITGANYTDDLALLANTPNQAETLLHSLERAAAGIGLHVNAHKTEYHIYLTPPLGQDMTQDQFFKRSLTGLNSEFSFSYTSCITKAEEPRLPYYLPIAGGRIIGFIPFPRVCEMQSVQDLNSCRRVQFPATITITLLAHPYTTGTKLDICVTTKRATLPH